MTARRWVTTEWAGFHRPGLTVDRIELTNTGGRTAPHNRDAHTTPGGDGTWHRVRHANGILIGMVRTRADLATLGIDPATLQAVA